MMVAFTSGFSKKAFAILQIFMISALAVGLNGCSQCSNPKVEAPAAGTAPPVAPADVPPAPPADAPPADMGTGTAATPAPAATPGATH